MCCILLLNFHLILLKTLQTNVSNILCNIGYNVCSVSAPIQGKSQKLAVQAFFTFMGTLGQTTLCTKAIIKSKCCVQLLLLSTYSQADCFYLVPLDKRTKHPFSQSTQLQVGTLESLSPHFIHRLLLALYHNGAASVKQ